MFETPNVITVGPEAGDPLGFQMGELGVGGVKDGAADTSAVLCPSHCDAE